MPLVAGSNSGSRHSWRPCQGIKQDVTARLLPHYRSDWVQGLNWGTRIIPPSTYIFFASVLPALAFGQQLATDTEGTLNVVHVLVSTALAGLTQAMIGGQPLLIIGVAEPIVIVYGFMHSYAKAAAGLGVGLFLPWAAWVCVWTAVMCCLLALLGACDGIAYFTRFSGELFGGLIAILFLQVGIKGIVREFYPAEGPSSHPAASWPLTLINGLWSLLLSLALLSSCLLVLKARSWRLGRGWLRGFLADYGVPLMVVLWSGVSFAVSPAPGVPRRVTTPNTWQVRDTWTVASRLGDVPGPFIAAALVPAIIITVLFYFDHNVSSQMAQQPEFNLVKGPAYHWDFLLLSVLTLMCGLLGLPPVNGVLPQAPMHTRSLAQIRRRTQPASMPDAAAAHDDTEADDGASIHSSGDCATDWLPEERAGQGVAGKATSLAGVTQSLSELQLRPQAPQQLNSTATFPKSSGRHHQQQAGVGALTTALTHMHIDTPDPPDAVDSPFGTPTASAGRDLSGTPFQPVVHVLSAAAAAAPAAGTSHALRHRQRSLSPTAYDTACGSEAASIAPWQHLQRGGRSRGPQQRQPQQAHQQLEVQGRHGAGLLHPTASDVAINTLPDSTGRAADADMGAGGVEDKQAHQGSFLGLEVREQRVSNLLQSLLVAACLAITPAIQQIPTGVLWGYFILLSVKSLEGSQLWERLLLLVTDPKKRVAVLQQEHAAYLQLVPYRIVKHFTLLQLVYLLGVWALTTWAGIAGIAFPLPIMALVPLRQFVLPRMFDRAHLRQLDAADYEEAPPVSDELRAAQELFELGAIAEAPGPELPVSAAGGERVGGELWGQDEAEVVSREFHGLQVRHHLTRESLEQQQQQLRRRAHQ